MHDIAEFLSSYEPFDGMDEAELDALAQRVEVEYHPAGEVIFRQGDAPVDRIRVVRRGSAELVDRGRVIDLLIEGEMFGHPSMLSGAPTGFEVRAAEDLLAYAIRADDCLPLLARPAGLRFLGRSILDRPRPAPADEPPSPLDVSGHAALTLAGEPPLIVDPDTTVREAVRRMEDEGASAIIVSVDDGQLGIVTDRDLRAEIVAGVRSPDAVVREVMTTPVESVRPDQSGAELMLAMLEHGIHHMPVVTADSQVLGIVRDVDLLTAQTGTPFLLRRSIASAGSIDELGGVVDQLNQAVVALDDARLPADQISAVIAVVSDALIRRAIELAVERRGRPPVELAWLSLGSHGRREAVPSSDVDAGLSWRDPEPDRAEEAGEFARAVGGDVAEALTSVGWRLDARGVTPTGEFSASSIGDWRRAIAAWLEHPEDNKVLIATSILLDGRTVFGPDDLDPKGEFFAAGKRETLLRWMLRLALAAKPPTGFRRNIVVEHSGEHKGTLDIKHGGLLPVVDIARYAALSCDSRETGTFARLRAARESGVLETDTARTLAEAYELFAGLRIEHQAEQLRRGEEPDDHLDPRHLNQLTRRYLRDAFREVTSVQKQLTAELPMGR
jgi:CBS domain-containing protein